MRVEAEGISQLHSIKPVSHAGNDCGGSSIGSIHMYPAHFNTHISCGLVLDVRLGSAALEGGGGGKGVSAIALA